MQANLIDRVDLQMHKRGLELGHNVLHEESLQDKGCKMKYRIQSRQKLNSEIKTGDCGKVLLGLMPINLQLLGKRKLVSLLAPSGNPVPALRPG